MRFYGVLYPLPFLISLFSHFFLYYSSHCFLSLFSPLSLFSHLSSHHFLFCSSLLFSLLTVHILSNGQHRGISLYSEGLPLHKSITLGKCSATSILFFQMLALTRNVAKWSVRLWAWYFKSPARPQDVWNWDSSTTMSLIQLIVHTSKWYHTSSSKYQCLYS